MFKRIVLLVFFFVGLANVNANKTKIIGFQNQESKNFDFKTDSIIKNKISSAPRAYANPSFEKGPVLDIINKVNTYWQKNNQNLGNAFWHVAAYHTGNIEAYKITNNPIFLKYSKDWAQKNNYKGATSNDTSNWKYGYGESEEYVLFGDWQICFQTYIDIYNLEGQIDAKKIARALEVMEYQMSTSANDYWWWADGLYMVMPVMTKLYNLTKKDLYLEKLKEYFTYADDIMYDKEAQLYYRDARYVYPNHKTVNGKKDFWARGAGWVFAGLAKILQDLPKDAVHREVYVSRFQSMAAALARAQQADGYWTRSILDPEHAPGPETSGTAFFTYGYLWGMNNGLLEKKKYKNVVDKSWNYLKNVALQENGKVGYVQPIGDRAIPGQVVNANSSADFGVGAYLLAASEMYRYLEKNTLLFDFGTATSVLESNAIRVTNTTLINNGDYGFDKLNGLLASDDYLSNKLTTDYVSGSASRIFKVKLYNGTYKVSIVQGTNTTALLGQTIKVNGVEVLTNGFVDVAEWKMQQFEVKIDRGFLELEISNANGENGIWVMNSLEIETKELSLSGVNILEDSQTIYDLNSVQLQAMTFPAGVSSVPIIWSSDHEEIVTVDAKGLVTAKSSGTATVNASIGNLTDSCVIYVNPIIPLGNYTVFDFGTTTSPLIPDAIRVDEFTQLNASFGWVNPDGIMSRARGSSSSRPGLDFVLFSEDKEFQVVLENGIYEITTTHGNSAYAHDAMSLSANDLTVVDDFNSAIGEYVTHTFEVPVTHQKLSLMISDHGGRDVNWVWNTLEIDKKGVLNVYQTHYNAFKIYPNPIVDLLQIQNLGSQNILKTAVYSVLGKKVMALKNNKSIDVSSLEKGVYILKIYTDNHTVFIKKFIKK